MKVVAGRYRYCPDRAWAGSMIEREQEEGNEATALLESHERMGSRSAERELQSSLRRMEAYSLEFISRREFFSAPLA
jgi:hypothetical protein